jgi:hypothetical protein
VTKLALSVPWNHDDVPWHFIHTLWKSDIPKGSNTLIARGYSHDITHARNITVGAGLEWGADELLLLDVDQHIPADVLTRLRAHDKDIVGALTPLRIPPYHWSLYKDNRLVKLSGAKLQEVHATGIGCMLVKRRVFETVPKPWFKREFSADGMVVMRSDDHWFCRSARESGFSIWVDTTLESGHEHTVTLCAKSLGREINV